MTALGKSEYPECVESDGSKKLKADIPAGRTDRLFLKPPQSGLAEEQPLAASAVTISKVSGAELRESLLSGSVIMRLYS